MWRMSTVCLVGSALSLLGTGCIVHDNHSTHDHHCSHHCYNHKGNYHP